MKEPETDWAGVLSKLSIIMSKVREEEWKMNLLMK